MSEQQPHDADREVESPEKTGVPEETETPEVGEAKREPPPSEEYEDHEALRSKASRPLLADRALRDRSRFRGHVSAAGHPCGHGVLYTALGTHTYSGVFASTDDETIGCRLGVQLRPNGTLFAGGFEGEYPNGWGVKRDPFGSQFIGEWREGELDGEGLGVNVDGDANWGTFQLNELADPEVAADRWKSKTQDTVLRALLEERHALQANELARALELRVRLEELSTVGEASLMSSDEIQRFAQDDEASLRVFLEENKLQFQTVEQESDRWKFQEAQLKEKQKHLRREITETRVALSYTSKYVALAETRRAQLADAERTLQSLLLQIEKLEP